MDVSKIIITLVPLRYQIRRYALQSLEHQGIGVPDVRERVKAYLRLRCTKHDNRTRGIA